MDRRKLAGIPVGVLGYGCMRFPIDRDSYAIDEEKAKALLRRAMEAGVTYYDTAWPYHGGQSEPFLGRALADYPRDSYQLATKLPCWEVDSLDRAEEIFAQQLRNLDTDFVDFYLLHSLTLQTWRKMVELGVLQWLEGVQREGKIRRLGFSFHDSLDAFREILTFRRWDFCQIQLNYLDTEHQAGLEGYRLVEEQGVPVVVMEPVKGGSLAQLPEEAARPLAALDSEASAAAWAMRWVGSLPNVRLVLSGMTTQEQLEDNLATFADFRPLSEEERTAVEGAAQVLKGRLRNGCTACRYCLPCPAGVDIPQNFAVWNAMSVFQNKKILRRMWRFLAAGARGDRCTGCGRCEELCPQHIPIRAHLARVTEEVETFAELR